MIALVSQPSQPPKSCLKWTVAVRPSGETVIESISGHAVPGPHSTQPDWLGSLAHCHVYLRSFIVSGCPSDHSRFGLSLRVMVNVVPLTTTPPLATDGRLAQRSGTYLPSDEIVAQPRRTGRLASMSASAVV